MPCALRMESSLFQIEDGELGVGGFRVQGVRGLGLRSLGLRVSG